MYKKFIYLGIIALAATSCSDSNASSDDKTDARKVHVDYISPEIAKVRDYVPPFAVVAHRGSTFWAPEETESAFRWGRDMGVDYLECDMQVTKDGVVLALPDDNLKRTTNIEFVYGETVHSTLKQ